MLALYRRYQEEGEAFKPGYLRLLSYGGSARPEEILAEVGIDITDRAFWQGGFDLVRERIDELEAIEAVGSEAVLKRFPPAFVFSG